MASALFSPITLRGLTLPNRVVVSPMCQYNSTDGSANDWHLMHLGSFSLGAAALVMTEMTNVNAVGRITHKCAGRSIHRLRHGCCDRRRIERIAPKHVVIAQVFGERCDPRRYDGHSACHGLQNDEPEAFSDRRKDE